MVSYAPKEITCEGCEFDYDPREYGVESVSDYETDEQVQCPKCGQFNRVQWIELEPYDVDAEHDAYVEARL